MRFPFRVLEKVFSFREPKLKFHHRLTGWEGGGSLRCVIMRDSNRHTHIRLRKCFPIHPLTAVFLLTRLCWRKNKWKSCNRGEKRLTMHKHSIESDRNGMCRITVWERGAFWERRKAREFFLISSYPLSTSRRLIKMTKIPSRMVCAHSKCKRDE